MVFLTMTLLLVLFLAWLIDALLGEEEVKKWRLATRELRARFQHLDVFAATEASNLWFLGLFKAIYGERFFSRRRLLTSALSTLLAMLMVAYVFEIYGVPGFHILYRGMLSGMVALTAINLVADYLSLQETFWIMKLSQRRGFFGILLLSILDVLLTTVIYVATVIGLAVFGITNEAIIVPLLDLMGDPTFELVDEDLGVGVFFGILAASTYVTSLLWICFVVSAIAVRLLQMASPTLQRLIGLISAAERPALAVAGFVGATTVVSYAAVQAVIWAGMQL